MSERPATKREIILVGTGAAAIGLYFMLVGLGLLPVPGGPRNLHAPLWVVLCAGAAFHLGGVAVLMQGISGADASGELPADLPQWRRAVHYLIGLAIFSCFGAIASWIAFVPGPREFSGSFMFFEGPVSAAIGRTVFGIGAIIIWLCTIAYGVAGARKLLGRGKSQRP